MVYNMNRKSHKSKSLLIGTLRRQQLNQTNSHIMSVTTPLTVVYQLVHSLGPHIQSRDPNVPIEELNANLINGLVLMEPSLADLAIEWVNDNVVNMYSNLTGSLWTMRCLYPENGQLLAAIEGYCRNAFISITSNTTNEFDQSLVAMADSRSQSTNSHRLLVTNRTTQDALGSDGRPYSRTTSEESGQTSGQTSDS